uniref:Uncharacterized protein n=1 Tax=Nelumbo nucifera TaxID=4432 RepID=A0A822YF23_NELNU|nr:TPA_asm: hypothetical protein HUJ06_031549 [Nelumbo nucifera]
MLPPQVLKLSLQRFKLLENEEGITNSRV